MRMTRYIVIALIVALGFQTCMSEAVKDDLNSVSDDLSNVVKSIGKSLSVVQRGSNAAAEKDIKQQSKSLKSKLQAFLGKIKKAMKSKGSDILRAAEDKLTKTIIHVQISLEKSGKKVEDLRAKLKYAFEKTYKGIKAFTKATATAPAKIKQALTNAVKGFVNVVKKMRDKLKLGS